MKKFILITLFTMGVYCSHSQSLETDCDGIANEEFTILSYKESKQFIKNYATFHSSNWEKHTRAYYLNNRTILFIDSFFTKMTNYKGINIHFVTPKLAVTSEQIDKEQPFLYITPVLDPQIKASDHNVFLTFFNTLRDNTFFNKELINKGLLCPGNCDDSLIYWGADFIEYTRLKNISGNASNSDKILFSQKSAERANRDRFDLTQGREFGGHQTKSVYFGKETIRRLKNFIRDGTNISIFPLVGIYFGSYDALVDEESTGQEHPRQTTLGFVPLRKIDNYFEPDICSYINYIKNNSITYGIKKDEKTLRLRFTDNHGELCPKNCPPIGD